MKFLTFFGKNPSSLDKHILDPNLTKDLEEKKSIRFAKFMLELNHKIITWGSDDVLKAWSEIKKHHITKALTLIILCLQ